MEGEQQSREEKKKASQKCSYQKHREKRLDYQGHYYEAHKAEILESFIRYYNLRRKPRYHVAIQESIRERKRRRAQKRKDQTNLEHNQPESTQIFPSPSKK